MIQIQTRVGPIDIVPADLEVVFRLNPLALEQLKSAALERCLAELKNGAQEKAKLPPKPIPLTRQQRRQAEREAAKVPAEAET